MKKKIAILISGRGSNMRALVEAARAPDYPAQVALVLSNRLDAEGLVFAQAQGLATAIVDHRAFGGQREAFERAMHEQITASGADLVCLAGFMRLLTPWFIDQWHDRLINIHPSLLPAFKGLDTHARALAAGESWHGCTVHFVSDAMDEGPIIAQAKVPVEAGDTPESLAARVLVAEHQLYPQALAKLLEDLASEKGGPKTALY